MALIKDKSQSGFKNGGEQSVVVALSLHFVCVSGITSMAAYSSGSLGLQAAAGTSLFCSSPCNSQDQLYRKCAILFSAAEGSRSPSLDVLGRQMRVKRKPR